MKKHEGWRIWLGLKIAMGYSGSIAEIGANDYFKVKKSGLKSYLSDI